MKNEPDVVWVIVGYVSQVRGVYTTEKKADVQREILHRCGVETMPPIRVILNTDHDHHE